MENEQEIDFSFIPIDEVDRIMLIEECIRVTGSPPYSLSIRDKNDLIIYSRLRSRKIDEEKAKDAGPNITGARGR